jgi:hypothetical protein
MRQESSVKRLVFGVIAVLITLGSMSVQQAYAQETNESKCTLATLNGQYVFDATGYNIVNGGLVPKTVVEFLTFAGDGSLTSIGTAVVGVIVIPKHSGTGSYTVNDDCTGTLTFNDSKFTFDLYIEPHGRTFHMIQTVAGQMLAGEVRRVAAQELGREMQRLGIER